MAFPTIFIAALITVESGGNLEAIGKNGEVGCLQITEQLVDDLNRIYYKSSAVFHYEERKDKELSCLMAQLYLIHYSKPGYLPRRATLEDLARIWNGGPTGWKKDSTKPYWIKVRQEIVKNFPKEPESIGLYKLDQPK